ncbi:hypothetical protein [Paraburkholderia kirstenboschensis]|uniref:Uncharacterized protein n=1 Tax=Paraburkholderia kirstenboschensis TaxID=1245436 RepID=A0ABZ0EQE4_9BURK|nr:hypothetical protein [Paraburkholderia kirstenboschensis]WOD19140.1 hypothetical protein RW095_23045 [Paraburkholderia kirstenboschensis]
MDTSFLADLNENLQYDSGSLREPEPNHQANFQRRLNNLADVPLISVNLQKDWIDPRLEFAGPRGAHTL